MGPALRFSHSLAVMVVDGEARVNHQSDQAWENLHFVVDQAIDRFDQKAPMRRKFQP